MLRPADDDEVGVLFRYQDENYYYRLIVLLKGGPFWKVQVKDGDKHLTLSETKMGYESSTTYKVRIRLVGEKILACVDKHSILNARDGRYQTGRVGIQAYAQSNLSIQRVSVIKVE